MIELKFDKLYQDTAEIFANVFDIPGSHGAGMIVTSYVKTLQRYWLMSWVFMADQCLE